MEENMTANVEEHSGRFYDKLSEIGDYITIYPWEIDLTGVYRYKNRDGRNGTETKKEVASPIPILPTALLENIDSQTEKVELTFFKHGRWRSFIADRSVTAGRNTIIKLADKGIEVNSDNSASLVKYIADAVASSLGTIPHKPAKSVLGWVDGRFMPYTDDIIFDGDDQYKHLYKAVSRKGDMQAWIDFARPLRNNLEVRLCMAASFASPLIELIGENPFVFHLWGGTGAAKTVTLMLAMSIWGNPAMGAMTRTMNMTANSMLGTASFLKNLPFAGDELQTIKSRWTNYDNLIMCITEGIDRGRMSYDRINETKSWKCSFIFSGEEPCIKQSSGGGAKNRVIEVECVEKLIENGNETANFVRSHYGAVGPVYINVLSDYDITAIYTDYFQTILNRVDTTDKQAGSMAMLLTADRIASELFWPDEEPIKILQVAKYLASAKEVDVTQRAYDFILDAVARNASKFSGEDREIWGRSFDSHILINKTVLEELLSNKGFEFDAVKSKWRDRGWLVPNSQGKLVHQTKCHGAKATYIKLTIPSDDESDELPFQ